MILIIRLLRMWHDVRLQPPRLRQSHDDLIVLAGQRGGEDLGAGQTPLLAGDHLLLQGTWEALDKQLADPKVLVATPRNSSGGRPYHSASAPYKFDYTKFGLPIAVWLLVVVVFIVPLCWRF